MEYKNGSTLYLHVEVGTVEMDDGTKIDLWALPNGTPLIHFPDGSSVLFRWEWMVEKAKKFKEEQDKNEK